MQYRDAASDPIPQVERIYAAIGIALSPEARAAMERRLAADTRGKRPAHHYSAQQFGLSEAAIREAFADYIGRFIDPAR